MRRVLFTAWIISIVLGALAPIAPKDGSHYIVVGVGLVVMVITMVLIGNLKKDRAVALSMSLSGLTLGAGLGFGCLAMLSPDGYFLPFAGKWLLIGCVLSFIFWIEFRAAETETEMEILRSTFAMTKDFESLTDAQKLEFKEDMHREIEQMKAYSEWMSQRNRRRFMATLPTLLIGFGLILWSTLAERYN